MLLHTARDTVFPAPQNVCGAFSCIHDNMATSCLSAPLFQCIFKSLKEVSRWFYAQLAGLASALVNATLTSDALWARFNRISAHFALCLRSRVHLAQWAQPVGLYRCSPRVSAQALRHSSVFSFCFKQTTNLFPENSFFSATTLSLYIVCFVSTVCVRQGQRVAFYSGD